MLIVNEPGATLISGRVKGSILFYLKVSQRGKSEGLSRQTL